MLKVSIDLIQFGLMDKGSIAKAEIWNDGTGDENTGNYRYRLWKKRKKVWREGSIKGFKRNRYSAWELLRMILENESGNA